MLIIRFISSDCDKILTAYSIVLMIVTLSFTFVVRSEFTTFWTVLSFSALYPIYLVVVASLGLLGHARQLTGYSKWNPTAR